MNDPEMRRPQWTQMLSAFFAPKLGGTPDAWSAANSQAIARIQDSNSWQARLRASSDYVSFDRQYWIDWLHWMCELVGVTAPADEECVALGHAASRYITPRVRAALPGAAEAIRALHRKGYVLHTASGESSADLEGYLQGMGCAPVSKGCTGLTFSIHSRLGRASISVYSRMQASCRKTRW